MVLCIRLYGLFFSLLFFESVTVKETSSTGYLSSQQKYVVRSIFFFKYYFIHKHTQSQITLTLSHDLILFPLNSYKGLTYCPVLLILAYINNCSYINTWTHYNSKLSCVFQMMSSPTTSSSGERNIMMDLK